MQNSSTRTTARGFGPAHPQQFTAVHSPLLILGAVGVKIGRMQPAAMRNIVDTYVRYGNRKALDELRAHRERLIAGLKTLTGPYDISKPIALIEDEIAVIEAGLAKLDSAAAA